MILFHWIHSLWWPMSGEGYALGSSWAGANLSFFGIWYVSWRRHNCHTPRCLRVARHVVVTDGHHDLYCPKHRPKRPEGDAS